MDSLIISEEWHGFEDNQVEYDEELINLLKCVLCTNFCEEPTVITCCNSLACTKCYKKEIQSNPRCFKCGDLSNNKNPEVMVLELYSFLRAQCGFKCGGQFLLKEVEEHMRYCQNNPNALKLCEICELSFKLQEFSGHNCTKALLHSYKELKKEMSQLKLNTSDDLFERIQHSLKLHNHPLVKGKRRNGWRCNFCRSRHNSSEESYYCYECDIDCCTDCFDYTFGKVEDESLHRHHLELKPGNISFECSKCNEGYPSGCACWKCGECEYEICFKCRFIRK